MHSKGTRIKFCRKRDPVPFSAPIPEVVAIRAFIGVELGDLQKSEIARIINLLHKDARKGRWKREENLHLTLKFLPEVREDQLALIDAVIGSLAQQQAPFQLEFTGLGQFRGRDSIRVVWIGLAGDLQVLQQLKRQTEQGLVPTGFAAETRPYAPHITLGQDVVFTQDFQMIEQSLGPVTIEPIKVDHLTLFKSEQIEGRRVYTPILRYDFISC
ncbi:MAG: RNA 2',3'-cyclic phosphodiesterase [Clostridia bacterium]|nr:RNA 2',3'-cyclic phosphodiesterase [Clostridia bacterium]NCC75332.1 RNA 2',3'-cyclic phosphodiesterase [Clostridia bacterium]